MDNLEDLSDIQNFYKNSTVFLSGVTGFIGKLVLEKILRALPVKKIFVLVRKKNGISATERIQRVFQSPVFDVIKRDNNYDVFKNVIVMEGNCSLPMLGLSDEAQRTFIEEVDVIFHVAANIKLNETIKNTTFTNIRSTRDLIILAQRAVNIKAFVYVGTAYSNCPKKVIKEEIYPSKITAENLISICEVLDDECLNSMTKTLIGESVNTYTFGKQVTEEYINREARSLPICIVRPAVVVSTLSEPVPAFIDNTFGVAGFILANSSGLNRLFYCHKDVVLAIVPADIVVNACIAAGWQIGEFAKAIAKLNKFKDLHEYFVTHSVSLQINNTPRLFKKMSFKDKKLFNFDVTTINWEDYFSHYAKGLRVYVLKDPMHTLPDGFKHYSRLRNIFIGSILIVVFLLYLLIHYLFVEHFC